MKREAKAMADQLRHRGPDDAGLFVDPEAGLALGHRRLSVIDLSSHGHQPMGSPNGRYLIVFNGEVYNHLSLRKSLESAGFTFRGSSDTEVMLAAIEHWGLEQALRQFVGMFAIAVWDRKERTLTLARDRLGIKPLYYGWASGRFTFASELKAIRALPRFDNEVNRDAVGLLLRHGYIPTPHSIYQAIHKLRPGTYLCVDHALANRVHDEDELAIRAHVYWSCREAAEMGIAHRFNLPDGAAIDALDEDLRDAVALRMGADVPLGAFLSGGVDSSTVTALMQVQSTSPVRTFTIGFHEDAFDEAPQARAIAKHLGTDHYELYVAARDALDVVPSLPAIYDEPFADSSQIPMYLVSELARTTVKVALSGDGGDELFGGYARYSEMQKLHLRMNHFSPRARSYFARLLGHEFGLAARTLTHASRLLPSGIRPKNPFTVVDKLAAMLDARTDAERYVHLVSLWNNPSHVALGSGDTTTPLARYLQNPISAGSIEQMMCADMLSYLPDDCLTKIDRASMAVGLEARTPLLDHRIVEFAWRLPAHQKIRQKEGKWILRKVLGRYVPLHLTDHPKKGFSVPIGYWLRGPLRDWAEGLLSETRLRAEGFFDPGAIRRAWANHLTGKSEDPHRLWAVLMFQAWLQHPHP